MRIPVTLFLFIAMLHLPAASADVVKPALIEISAHTQGRVVVDMRVSLEALLSGINARYRNTQDAPNADEYDFYREMPAQELRSSFRAFERRLLEDTELLVDGERVPLQIESIDVPAPGYTRVPRISTVLLSGTISPQSRELSWYYPAAFGDNAVRVRQVDEANQRWHWSEWQWLRDDGRSDPFTLDELFKLRPLHETITSYIIIGFEHILPLGLDHILFIVGLFLLSAHFRPLLLQVTMFTVAHTITLGLAMNGFIDLPSRVVEPLIALSIAYVGFENIWHRSLHRSRLVLVFTFGLLHGMGFAGVLKDFGMPEDAFMTALISFNVGVELGQLAVILIAFAAAYLVMHREELYRKVIVVPASLLITVVGLFWTVERIVV